MTAKEVIDKLLERAVAATTAEDALRYAEAAQCVANAKSMRLTEEYTNEGYKGD